MITLELPDLDATRRLGLALGRRLGAGSVVALVGPLGAGKTHLSRSIAEGLGADPRLVTSPTFVLIQEYPGRVPVYHFDAYRLAGAAPFAELGVHEYLEGDGACLVEWADRVAPCLPADHLRVELEVTGETSRRARMEATGPRHAAALEYLSPGHVS
jgi:tRNA threonylcarbamoyladenosine biosynthesis protein TsaE